MVANRVSPAHWLIITHGICSVCLGVVFPFIAIHLADQPHIGTGGVAAYYAASGGANLALALLISSGVVRMPRVSLGVLGTVLWLVGFVLAPFAGSLPVLMLAAMCIGSGQGAYMAALIPIINSLVEPDERRRIFALRYAVLNATLATGALIGGLLTLVLPREAIAYFFVASGVGIVPLMLMLTLIAVRASAGAAEEADQRADDVPMPTLRMMRVALPATAFQLVAYVFAFSQFEATTPLVAERLMGMPLAVISVLLVTNVIVIVSVQRPMTRWLERYREARGLQLAVLLWACGYGIVALASLGSFEVRVAGLIAFAGVFALGECAYSSSFHPWLLTLVPERELTRVSALANTMMGVGNLAGPSIGVSLVLLGNASLVWLCLGMACTSIVLTMTWLARRSASAASSQIPAA